MINRFAWPCVVGALALWFAAGTAQAHFIWVKTEEADGQRQAVMVFGEDAFDELYHLPERVAGAEMWRRPADGDRTRVETEQVETDERIGLVGPIEAPAPFVLEITQKYGVYGGALLTYYAKHVNVDSNSQLQAVEPSEDLKFDIVPRAKDGELQLTVLWNGEPQADANVTVTVGDGEMMDLKTDDEGTVTVKPKTEGLAMVLANVVDKSQSGAFDDEDYNGSAHYGTLTFEWRQAESDTADTADDATSQQSTLPPLPEAISSFGGAVCDGWLYVYSGHIGTEHEHSAANLSQHFRRVPVDGSGPWEKLPMEEPLQGLALVAHGGKLYRVGGLTARNATVEQEADLHSTDAFSSFDPTTKEWTTLASLPDARSSHNAVVIGDKLYVVGGWTLAGEAEGQWIDHSLVYDFNDPGAGWQKLPEQSFQRRALAAGQWQGKLAVLGGMDDEHSITQDVEVFDPATRQWAQAAELPGRGMAGFGLSAWNLDGQLYACGFQGRLYRLDHDGTAWEEVARLDTPRFFHQLLPGGDDELLAVGGASREGHLTSIEQIDVGESASATSADDAQPAGGASRAADAANSPPASANSG